MFVCLGYGWIFKLQWRTLRWNARSIIQSSSCMCMRIWALKGLSWNSTHDSKWWIDISRTSNQFDLMDAVINVLDEIMTKPTRTRDIHHFLLSELQFHFQISARWHIYIRAPNEVNNSSLWLRSHTHTHKQIDKCELSIISRAEG